MVVAAYENGGGTRSTTEFAHYIFYTSDRNYNFINQAWWYRNELIRTTIQPVYMIRVNSAEEFIAEWNNMARYAGVIGSVSIFAHGTDRALTLGRGYENVISVDGLTRGDYRNGVIENRVPVYASISALYRINIKGYVGLFSCNSGHLDTYGHHVFSDGHNFASALSTRVSGGAVVGYDGAVGFGPAIGSAITAPATGNWRPRLSNNQEGFENLVYWRTDGKVSRDPLGPQQFVAGQLDNDFVPGRPPRRSPWDFRDGLLHEAHIPSWMLSG
jgi:hypothetical protein